MQRVALINGKNKNKDYDLMKILKSLATSGVVEGLEVQTGKVIPGYAFIDIIRDGEIFPVLFQNTADIVIDTTGTTKVYIEITQANIDDGTINNVDGTGIGSIKTGANYPTSNFIKLASITGGVITDERGFITTKENLNLTKEGNVFNGVNQLVKTNENGIIDNGNLPELSSIPFIFGDGSDGDLIISSGTTYLNLGQVYNFRNITISSGAILSTNSINGEPLSLKCSGILTNNGTIDLDGKGGTGSETINSDIFNLSVSSNIIPLGGAGGNGGNSSSYSTGVGGTGGITINSFGGGGGGGGGSSDNYNGAYLGGNGGDGGTPGGIGGAGRASIGAGTAGGTSAGGGGASAHSNVFGGDGGDAYNNNGINGEETGDGGGAGGGGAGGNSGSNGGKIILSCNKIDGNGIIKLNGLNGGNGGSGGNGRTWTWSGNTNIKSSGAGGAGGGGGAGGNGGLLISIVSIYTFTGSIEINNGIGGLGGSGGTAEIEATGGVNGNSGDDGGIGASSEFLLDDLI